VIAAYPDLEMGHFFLGLAAYQIEDYATARRAFEQAMTLHPERAETRAYQAAMAVAEEDYQRAVSLLNRELVTRFPPSQPEIRNLLALTYLAAGEPSKAIDQCQEALRRVPNFVDARVTKARALQALGRDDQALTEYREALDTVDRWRAAESLVAANIARGQRPEDNTEEVLYERYGKVEEFVRERGMWPALNKEVATLCARMGRFAEARNYLRRALNRYYYGNPNDADALTQIGMITYAEALKRLQGGELFSPWNMLQAAARVFNNAIDKDPDFSDAYRGLGLVYTTEATQFREEMAAEIMPHTLADAIEEFEEAIKADPSNAAAWRDMAEAQRLDGLLEEALNSATRALALADPQRQTEEWVKAQVEVANCLLAQGLSAQALRAAQRALERDPVNVPALLAAGKAHTALKQYDEARKAYYAVVEAEPENVEARVLMGDLFRETGSWMSARRRYQEALDLLPRAELLRVSEQKGRLLHLIGSCYLHEGYHAKAIQYLSQSLGLQPGNYVAQKELADAYAAVKRYDAAEAALRIALNLSPSLSEDAEIYNRLGRLAESRGLPHAAYRNYLLALRADPQNALAREKTEALER